MLEIEILRNYQYQNLDVLGVNFEGLAIQMMSRRPAG